MNLLHDMYLNLTTPLTAALFVAGILMVMTSVRVFRRATVGWARVLIQALAVLLGTSGLVAIGASNLGLPFVLNNGMLKLLPSTQYLSVWRLGVGSAFDAPALQFKPTASPCVLNGGLGDVGTEVPSANGGCFRAVHPSAGMDLRQFGASGSGRATTATTTSGSPNVTLASALDLSNGQGVVIGGAGAAFALNQPTGFGVTSTCSAKGGTGNITAGSKLVTGFQFGGLHTGDSVTGTGIPGGTTVVNYNPSTQVLRISNNATLTQPSVLTVTDPCNVTVFYRIAAYDSNGGIGLPLAGVSAVGPVTRSTWDFFCLTWTRPTGTAPAGYIVWYSVDGGTTYQFLQAVNAEGSGSCSAGNNSPFWDGGQPPAPRPWWVPDNPATIPVGGQPDWLRSTIISGGGTTALTLAANAGQTITTPTDPVIGTVMHDDTVAWTAFIGALNNLGGTGLVPSAQPPGVTLPSVYRINSGPVVTRDGVTIRQDPGSVLQPFGTGFGVISGVVAPWGGAGLGATYSLSDNFQEATSCLPLTSIIGLSLGQYMIVEQLGPGGTSQATNYTFMSKIVGLGCDGRTAVRLADSAPISFTDSVHAEKATITGALAAGDTVQIAISGEITCTAVYTVLGTDNVTTVARGLAQEINAVCPVVATNTLGVVNISVPAIYASFSFVGSSAHGGGGTEVVTMAAATPATVQVLTPVKNFTADGISIDGADHVGTLTGLWSEIAVAYVVDSRFSNVTLRNATGSGVAFLIDYSYGIDVHDVSITRGSSGVQNITSAATLWVLSSTKTKISNVYDVDALSFGPQLTSTAYDQISKVSVDQVWWGRGWKFAGALKSQINNLSAGNSVFKNIAICCGTYRSTFNNLSTYNSYGTNPTGIGFFDAWARFNQFSQLRLNGSVYEWDSGLTDKNNTVFGADVGSGGGLNGITVQDSKTLFYGVNGCQLAFNSSLTPGSAGNQNPTCQRDSGIWTPALQGDGGTPGTTTYSGREGTWEQDGRTMVVRTSIATSALITGSVGNIEIAGLPKPASSSFGGSCAIEVWKGITFTAAGYTQLTAGINGGGNTIKIFENGSGLGYSGLPAAQWANPAQLIISCVYPVQ